MALSDCPRCWDTPCSCGYMGYTIQAIPGQSGYERDEEKRRLKEENKRLVEQINTLKEAFKKRNTLLG